MAKKRFTEGLDSLFEETTSSGKPRGRKGREEESSRRSGTKDFSSDLSSLLQEAFEESFEEQLQKKEAKKDQSKKPERPLTGLDALIRSTIEPASVTIDPKAKRRLVVSFHESQLAKLKNIARLEKTQLKRIINTLVEDYIEAYEDKKGKLS